MLKTTRDAVRAICSTDPSITPEQLKTAVDALNGALQEITITGAREPMDRGLSRRQVAELLAVSPKTVTAYASKGLIRGVTLGDARGHIRRYSEASVRALMKGGAE